MSGSSILTFTAPQTYTGGTTISSGTIALNGSGTLASTGSVNLSGATAIFDISATTAATTTIGALTGVTSSQVNLGSKTLSVSNSTSPTFSGNIIGSGGQLIVGGSGTLILAGTNTYSGGTTVNSGVLQGDTNSLQGNIVNNAQVTFNITAGSHTYAGNMSGSAGVLVKSGSGNLMLSGTNTYGGGTTLNAGGILGTTTSLQGNISSAGSTSVGFEDNAIGTYAGALTGGAGLVMTGGGTLILTNTGNNYTGGTTNTFGTIQASSATLPGNVTNGGALVFNQTSDGTFAGAISGGGTITKMGSALLNLTNSSAASSTTVSAGTLAINGALSSPVSISTGAVLKGTGTVIGTLTNSGTVQPGNSIGTMNVVGDVTFNSGSTYAVEVSPTAASLLNITGNLTLQPSTTLQITPDAGIYSAPLQLTIAQTTGNVTGTFSNVTYTSPLVQFNVQYLPQSIVLSLSAAPFITVVPTGNASKVANSLSGVIPVPGSDLAFVFSQLMLLNAAQLNAAFNQMQPSMTVGLSLSQQNNFNLVTSALRKRTNALHEMRCTEEKCMPKPAQPASPDWLPYPRHEEPKKEDKKPCMADRHWDVWEDVSYGWYRQDGQNGNIGFKSNTIVGAAGFDYKFPSNVYLGALGAYTHSKVDWHKHAGNGNINSYYGGLYSSYLNNYFFINLSAIGSYNHYWDKRSIKFGAINRHAEAKHPGLSANGHLDLGFISSSKRKFQFYPFGQVDYTYLHQKKYHEHKAQSLNLHVSKYNATMLRNELGLQSRYCIRAGHNFVIPSAKLSWVRELRFKGKHLQSRLSNDLSSTNAPADFTVSGIYPDRSLIAPGAALTALFCNERLNFTLTYEGEFGKRVNYNAVNLTCMYDF
jgi:outer membrane autotransporter protein